MINQRIAQEEDKLKRKQSFRYLSWTTYIFVLLFSGTLTCIMSYCCCKYCWTCNHSAWKFWNDRPGCTELVHHCTIKQYIHTGPVYYQRGTISLPDGSSRQTPAKQSPVIFTELVSTDDFKRNKTLMEQEQEEVPLQHRLWDTKRISWQWKRLPFQWVGKCNENPF
mgnify:CR=1 FL=1